MQKFPSLEMARQSRFWVLKGLVQVLAYVGLGWEVCFLGIWVSLHTPQSTAPILEPAPSTGLLKPSTWCLEVYRTFVECSCHKTWVERLMLCHVWAHTKYPSTTMLHDIHDFSNHSSGIRPPKRPCWRMAAGPGAAGSSLAFKI